MARILSYPAVRQVNANEWELLEDLEYHVGGEFSTDIIIVPKSFITDFASVPKAFWWLLPPTGKYSPAALIHDFLYSTHARSRKECDKIFLEAMEVMSVAWWTRKTMYAAVRLFGGFAWKKESRS